MRVEKYDGTRQIVDNNTLRRMRFTCWITKATHTLTVSVILLDFQLQQCFLEGASVLRCTYIACLVTFRTSKYRKLR